MTIQAQIMQLLAEMREQFGAAIILITHDLGVVAQMCDRVAVMYTGNIIENHQPRHYLRNLCILILDDY